MLPSAFIVKIIFIQNIFPREWKVICRIRNIDPWLEIYFSVIEIESDSEEREREREEMMSWSWR